MLSEQDRMSLREIEDRLRESDGDLVRAFDILIPPGARRSVSGPRPVPSTPPRHDPILLRAVKWMLATAVVLSVVVIVVAASTGNGVTVVLSAAFGGLVGLACYVAATVLRPRRR